MKNITKSSLFYAKLFALLTFLMVFSWEVLDFAMHTVPAAQYQASPITYIGTTAGSLASGLVEWVRVLLLYWGWLIYKDWKTRSGLKALLWAVGGAAATLAVCYGAAVLFAVPTLQAYLKMFAGMTVIVLAPLSAVLSIAQLLKDWKTHGRPKALLGAAGGAAASLAVCCYGATLLFREPGWQAANQQTVFKRYAIITGIVLVCTAAALGIAQLLKRQRGKA